MSYFPNVTLDGSKSASRKSPDRASPFNCLFSSTKSMKIGSGMTSRRHVSTVYWFVRRVRPKAYSLQSVDGDLLPMGKEKVISEEKLLAGYTPELALFEKKMIPAVRQTRFSLDDSLFPGHSFTGPRLRICQSTVRSLFDFGMEYIRDGRDIGHVLINDILRLETGFEGADQFLFNRFGIALRKAGESEAAVRCYRKALQYTSCDDHLYYNLARAYYEGGKWWECIEALGWCFEYNSELTVSRWLVELIVALAEDESLRRRYGVTPVPDGVARRAGLLSEAISLTPMDKPPSRVSLERKRAQEGRLPSDVAWNSELQEMQEHVV